MEWKRAANGDIISGSWRVRGPKILGVPMCWIYRDGLRYTTTGRFNDAVSCVSLSVAKKFIESVVTAEEKS